MRKIAFVSNSSFSMYFFRKGVLSDLIAKGYEVHVICPYDYKTADVIALGCIHHQIDFSTRSVNPLSDLFLFVRLWRCYKRIRPEIIFHYTIKPNVYGTLAAKLLGLNSIAIITGLGYVFINDTWVNRLAKKLFRFALGFSQKVWFLNQADIDAFVANKMVDENKMFLLPGEGVNTQEYSLQPLPAQQPFTFILIARMLKDKGVYEYVNAAKHLKLRYLQVQFQLLGPADSDNPTAIPLQQVQAWHNEGYVQYLGVAENIQSYVKNAHVVVLPSYREGISKVLMEAASMGRPLIASNVPGCVELIEPGKNGLLCEPKSVESLAQCMEQMIHLDARKLQEMAEYSRQKMLNERDESKVIEIYHQVIEQLFNEKKSKNLNKKNDLHPTDNSERAIASLPKITVITCVYNNAKFVRDAIESVLSQRYPYLEYIVIDGGSTDGSFEIIQQYADRIHQVISEPDKGLYDALNKGISLATGEVIGVMHSDDFYAHRNVLMKVAKQFDNDTDAVYGNLDYISNSDSGKIIRRWRSGKYKRSRFIFGWMPPHPTVFVRKKVFEQFGGYNTTLRSSSDYELLLRLFYVNRIKVKFIDEVLVKMRIGGQSNRSVKNRLRSHFEDYKAWKIAGARVWPFTMIFKLLRKLPQFIG